MGYAKGTSSVVQYIDLVLESRDFDDIHKVLCGRTTDRSAVVTELEFHIFLGVFELFEGDFFQFITHLLQFSYFALQFDLFLVE